MANKAWKDFERRLARDWGTVRNALSGSNSKVSASDSHHPRLFLEGKLNVNSPFWRLYQKSKPLADKEGKAVVLCLGKKSHKGYILAVHRNDLDAVVMERLRQAGVPIKTRKQVRAALLSSRKNLGE